MFLLFLFKTHLDLNKCNFLFLFLLLIFFNLDANVESHVVYVDIILIFLIFSVCQLCKFRLWRNDKDKNETRFLG